ncbi:MAG: hypothetical protein WA954_08125 [Parerythrobacter sp.]
MPEGNPTATELGPDVGDAAIWRDLSDATLTFRVAADPQAGLLVHDREGALRSTLPATGLTHIDLVTMRDGTILVAASDRSDPALAYLFLAILNPETGDLERAARVPVGPGIASDICIGVQQAGGGVEIYSPLESGAIFRTTLARSGEGWSGLSLQPFSVPGQAARCHIEPGSERLLVGEENVGIWRFSPASPNGTLVLQTGGRALRSADWAAMMQ